MTHCYGYIGSNNNSSLAPVTTTMNAYIQASIACVQQADNQMLQQIILQGLNKLDATT
jgi:hypothetical protein